jgi:hypothetical protein
LTGTSSSLWALTFRNIIQGDIIEDMDGRDKRELRGQILGEQRTTAARVRERGEERKV